MGITVLTTCLVIFASAVPILGLIVDPGDWPARFITALDIGIAILVMLVQGPAAESALIAGSWHLQAGSAVSIVVGGLIACRGTVCGPRSNRGAGAGRIVCFHPPCPLPRMGGEVDWETSWVSLLA